MSIARVVIPSPCAALLSGIAFGGPIIAALLAVTS
jgi:hypothetical protein